MTASRYARAERVWSYLLAQVAPAVTSAAWRPARLSVTALEERVVPARPLPYPVVAAGSGPGAPAAVTLTDADTGAVLHTFAPYGDSFTGGASVAVGDLTGDGYPDVVVTPRAGGGPHVRVFDGKSGLSLVGPLGNFMAFEASFAGGLTAAVGDFTGDGRADLAVGAGAGGGPRVRVLDGVTGQVAADFFAFEPGFAGGVALAAGKFDGSGRDQLVVGAGAGGGPRVRVLDLAGGSPLPIADFWAFEPGFSGGVNVAAGDVTGDGRADVVAGAGAGGGPRVRVFDGAGGAVVKDFMAFDPSSRGGAGVGASYVSDDQYAEVTAATGPGSAPRVRTFDGVTGAVLAGPVGDFDPGVGSGTGGVSVAAGNDPPPPGSGPVLFHQTYGYHGATVEETVTQRPDGKYLWYFDITNNAFWGAAPIGYTDVQFDPNYIRPEVYVWEVANGQGWSAGPFPALVNGIGWSRPPIPPGVPSGTTIDPGGGTGYVSFTTSPRQLVASRMHLDDSEGFDMVGPGAPIPPASVGDFVWDDADGNGVQDAGEPGRAGVTVRLLDSGGAPLATATTNSQGKYLFDGLAPGGYQLQFVNPDPRVYRFSPPDQGSSDLADSDALVAGGDPSVGLTAPFSLAAGQADLSRDAGLRPAIPNLAPAPSINPCPCTPAQEATSTTLTGVGNWLPDPLSAPVRPADGLATLSYSDLYADGFGGPWGQTRSWSSNPAYAVNSTNGNGWSDSARPRLLRSMSSLILITNSSNAYYFDGAGTPDAAGNYPSYSPRFFDQTRLTYDAAGDQFVVADSAGDVLRFRGFGSAWQSAGRGALASRADPAGVVTQVTAWDALGRALEISRSTGGAADSVTESFLRSYRPDTGANPGLLDTVQLRRRVGTGPWDVVRSVVYDYYGAGDANGNLGDLRFATVLDPSGLTIDRSYYRYYTADGPTGYRGGLKYALGPRAFARADAELGGALGAPDPSLALYADNAFEYDALWRVTKATVAGEGCSACSGGQGAYAYNYATSANPAGFNSWRTRTVETLPDLSTRTVYTNPFGQTMLNVVTPASLAAPRETYYRYQDDSGATVPPASPPPGPVAASAQSGAVSPPASPPASPPTSPPTSPPPASPPAGQYNGGRLALEAEPSAVTGHSETYADLVNYQNGNAQYLADSAGLLTAYTYYASTTATETAAGGAAGFDQGASIQRGELGAAVPQAAWTYFRRAAAGATVTPLASETVYRNDDGTGAQTTTHSYAWYSGTAQAYSATTTLPAVSAAQNGPGAATASTVVFDAFGRPAWTKDASGFLSYAAYDAATGAVTKSIADVNTALAADFAGLPAGWATPAGGGLHLATAGEVDNLGRPTKATDPSGRVTYATYNDANHEVRLYRGWNPALNAPTGPTEVARDDRARGYTETLTMSAAPAVSGGRPTGAEAVSGVQSLSRELRNAAGQAVTTDDYFNLSGVAYAAATATLGSAGANYYRTQSGYDKQGKPNRTVSAAGVITRVVMDGEGRPLSTWVGTNDTPATGFWSPSNPAGMTKVAEVEYDNGAVGDGNATRVTEYPGLGARPRVTQVWYDWRDRPVAWKSGVGLDDEKETAAVNRPLAYAQYDNLGETVSSEVYDGDSVTLTTSAGVPQRPAASLLRAKSTASYDELGRVYLAQTYLVDQATGAAGAGPLTTNVWYDLRGYAVKASTPAGLVAKTAYDGAGRATVQYATDGGGDASWADALTVAGDKVLRQAETAYDAASNAVLVTARQRFDGETATGALGTPTAGPRARVTYSAWYYDPAGRVTAGVDVGTNGGAAWARPASAPAASDSVLVTAVGYDAAGNAASTTAPDGTVAQSAYDLLGRVTQSTQAAGSAVAWATAYAYDSGGRLASVTEPGSRTTTYAYDPLGRASGVTERAGTALARTWSTAYDYLDEAVSETDPLGVVTTTAYDPAGRVTSATEAAGTALARTTSAGYDALSRVVSSTDARGFTTSTKYDDPNLKVVTTDALGYAWTAGYDRAGNLVSSANPLGQTSTAAYDLLGRVTSTADALGKATTYQYFVGGDTVRVTDPLGRATSATLDALGRVASSKDGLGRVTAYGYDRLGRTVGVTDARGTLFTRTYDALGRVVGEADAVGQPEQRTRSYVYNAAGDMTRAVSPNGVPTDYGYDSAGRVTSVTAASGRPEALTTTVGYDLLDRTTSVTRPGNRTTNTAYDILGRAVTVTEAAGTSLQRSTTLAYDAGDNLVSVTDPLGFVTQTSYDALGRPSASTDALGGVTKVAYDAAGRTKSLTDPSNNVTSWGYDADGRATSETDPLGKVTAYAYDAAGQLVTLTDRLGRRKEFAYDLAGQVTQEAWYSAANSKLDTRTFGYDANGALTSASNGNGAYTFTRDRLERVTATTQPFGVSMAMTYDADGNRLTLTDSLGGSQASTYDGLDRLTGRQQTAPGVTAVRATWSYNSAGDAATLSRSVQEAESGEWARAGSTSRSYDALGRVTDITTKSSTGVTLSSYSYGYDAGDRLTSETVNGVARTYAYDKAGQLTSDGGQSISYDANGNRTSGGSVVGPGNRLTSDGVWTYGYDDAGAVTSKSKSGQTWTYAYDLDGQMTSATDGTTTVTYTFDVFGNRLQRAQNGAAERFVYDGFDTAKPSAVGSEGFDAAIDLDATNAPTARRVFGPGFDAPLAWQTVAGAGAGQAAWYDADRLGSVRAVLAGDGSGVTGRRDYAGFGAVTAQTGVGLDRYGFTGREQDGALGLSYNRARMYDPATGRFTSEDPAGFAAGDANLSRYLGNAPTGATDPSGMWSYDGVRAALVAAGRPEVAEWLGGKTDGRPNAHLNSNTDWWYDNSTGVINGIAQFNLDPSANDAQAAAYILGIVDGSIQHPTIYRMHLRWLELRVYGRIEDGRDFEQARADYAKQALKGAADAGLAGVSVIKGVYTLPSGVALADGIITVLDLADKDLSDLSVSDLLILSKFVGNKTCGVGKNTVVSVAKGKARQVTQQEISRLISLKVLQDSCFAAGTPIRAPGGSRPVEDFAAGDLVLSRDEFDPEGEVVPKVVEETFRRLTTILEVWFGPRAVRTTGEHPFYVAGRGWTPARELVEGDRVASSGAGTSVVSGVRDTGEWAAVYNFRVADFHTYFVGGDDWGFDLWAHNACGTITHEAGVYILRDSTGKIIARNASQERIIKEAEKHLISYPKTGNGNPLLAEIELGTDGDYSIVAAKPRLADKTLKKRYENQGDHDPTSAAYQKKKGVLPQDHVELFKRAFLDPSGDKGTLYAYEFDSKGRVVAIHRFQGQNGAFHWNGSTNGRDGYKQLRPLDGVPASLMQQIGKPLPQ